jgi:hypothetical protein
VPSGEKQGHRSKLPDVMNRAGARSGIIGEFVDDDSACDAAGPRKTGIDSTAATAAASTGARFFTA